MFGSSAHNHVVSWCNAPDVILNLGRIFLQFTPVFFTNIAHEDSSITELLLDSVLSFVKFSNFITLI